MNASTAPPLGITALVYVVVIAIFVWRMMRPARVSAARIWSRPAILAVVTALAIWAELRTSAAPAWEVAVAIVAGAALGVPLGIVRGRHSHVSATDRPGVFVVQSSPLVVIVWLLAFVARAAVRYAVPSAGHSTTIWSLALLAFAATAIAVSATMIHGKLQAVTRGTT